VNVPDLTVVIQQAPDSDMALVHDDDLELLVDAVRLFFHRLSHYRAHTPVVT